MSKSSPELTRALDHLLNRPDTTPEKRETFIVAQMREGSLWGVRIVGVFRLEDLTRGLWVGDPCTLYAMQLTEQERADLTRGRLKVEAGENGPRLWRRG